VPSLKVVLGSELDEQVDAAASTVAFVLVDLPLGVPPGLEQPAKRMASVVTPTTASVARPRMEIFI
jgi:hypothetical protein